MESGKRQFTDAQVEKIERYMALPLGLLLLGVALQADASQALRGIHKESQRLGVESAVVRSPLKFVRRLFFACQASTITTAATRKALPDKYW